MLNQLVSQLSFNFSVFKGHYYFQDFVETFGAPVAGAEGGDIWRGEGLASGPTYASYAAQAWLQNSSPVTMVRLLGEQSDDAATATGVGCAGWYAGNDGSKNGFAWSNEGPTGGGAFGLCLLFSVVQGSVYS